MYVLMYICMYVYSKLDFWTFFKHGCCTGPAASHSPRERTTCRECRAAGTARSAERENTVEQGKSPSFSRQQYVFYFLLMCATPSKELQATNMVG